MRNLTESSGKPLIVVLLLACALPAHASDVLRCGSRLVSTEATADEVRKVCGEPDFVDRWDSGQSPWLGGAEEWYYDFGPSQLLRVLHFQHGQLTDIQSEGYGFGTGGAHDCDPYQIGEGISKYRLLENCGEPVSRQVGYALRPLMRPGDRRPARGSGYVYTEEWLYNFGASYLVRVVTLENGRVTEVRSEGRGHD